MALHEIAHVQYDKWRGTVAGDDVDLHPLGELLAIDSEVWWVIEVEASSYGGSQYLKAWAVPASEEYQDLVQLLNDVGHIETTLVVDRMFEMDDRHDTNPIAPIFGSILNFADFVSFGFKRLNLRMQYSLEEFPDGYPTQEVESAVDQD